MNTPRIPFSLSFLKRIVELPENFRIFVIGSAISIYGLVLYELFPEFLFNPNFSIYYFIIPMTVLGVIGIGLPRFMPIILEKVFKRPPTKPAQKIEGTSDDIIDDLVTEGSSQQIVQQDPSGIMSSQTEGSTSDSSTEIGNKELDELIAGTDGISEEKEENTVGIDPTSTGQGFTTSSMTVEKIRELIDEKFEPVENDLSSFKKDLNKIKEDMKITKESVDTLTESFEGTLTDMKAFQAEISNPLNFMRKYFESIDLKSLEDPSRPLRQQLEDSSVPLTVPIKEKETIIIPGGIQVPSQSLISGGGSVTPESGIPSSQTFSKPTESKDTQIGKEDSSNPMDSVMKPLFSGNLSVGKMMSIIELAGDMLNEQGDDCIDLLIEQCKLMGLKAEDENTIYNIIDMLKNSGMDVEDSLIQLYKFSQIVGITDKEADAHYAKLIANRKREKK